MSLVDAYLRHISSVRRYSPRTQTIYAEVLASFVDFACGDDRSDESLLASLVPQVVRGYEVFLMDSKKLSPRTVGQHLSVLSGFSRFLMQDGRLAGNPVRMVARPKVPKRLPTVLRKEVVEGYLADTASYSAAEGLATILGPDKTSLAVWTACRDRLIIHLLYDTGVRRAELISLRIDSFDPARGVLHVRGKGDKMREIPLLPSLCQEILLYLQATAVVRGGERSKNAPLLETESGRPLYPVAVDRIVKKAFEGVVGRKSPHILRHTLATGLLDEGADLNAIKELLGHASLAATQVYTHNSAEKLKQTYLSAHPRAGRGKKG